MPAGLHAPCVREAREELGVDVTPVCELASFEVPRWEVVCTGWLVDGPRDGFDPSPHEVAELRWMTAEEIVVHCDLLESSVVLARVLAGRMCGE